MAPLSCRRIFRAGGVCVQFPGMRLRVRTYTGRHMASGLC